MTPRRCAYAVLGAIVLLLVAVQGASAATSQQIHSDAADGYIDGTYTLAELREANRTAPAELVEYGGWQEAYQNALQRLTNPTTPPTVAPRDEDGDGRISPAEKAKAVERTRELQDEAKDKPKPNKVVVVAKGGDDEGDDDEGAGSSDDDGDDDGGSPLIWLIAGIPLLIIVIGGWRMLRRRGAEDSAPVDPRRPNDPPVDGGGNPGPGAP